MYKPEELLEADERKRKEKGINIEVPQKKKRVSDEETMEFINSENKTMFYSRQVEILPAPFFI